MAEHIVILGNGISGITTARFVRKYSDKKITVISKETEHFFSRTALMYIYMGHMTYNNTKPYEDWFWEKNDINLVFDTVTNIDFRQQQLELENTEDINYDKLVLGVGSVPNKFGWKGQGLPGVQGLYSYQDLQLLEKNTAAINRAIVVGGGLIGIELTEMLLTRNIPVTMLVREDSFWNKVLPAGESEMINRHIREHHADLRLNTELDEIIEGEDGKASAVKTKEGETIECQLVGLTAGVRPNVDFLRDTSLEVDKGILINEYFETSLENVYAIGDCAEFREPLPGRRPVEQVWYTGRMHGETLAKTLTGNKIAYNPGPWFNSAKFFDIEYQTYGMVPPVLEDHQDSFYWEHESGKICLHIVFDKDTEKVTGVNNFGIRLRHPTFEQWFAEDKDIDYVIAHLKDANFDPEIYARHEPAIVESYNQKRNKNIQLKKKSWKRILNYIPVR